MTVELFRVRKGAEEGPIETMAWAALAPLSKEDARGWVLFRSVDGSDFEPYPVPLGSADFGIELFHVSPDLAWGVKSWEDYAGPTGEKVPIYLFEAHIRVPDSPIPLYVREKSTDALKLMTNLARVLTDPEWRAEALAHNDQMHHEARIIR